MVPETAVYYSNFVISKFYREVYFSDTEACQGLHLFPLRDDVILDNTFVYLDSKRSDQRSTFEICCKRIRVIFSYIT